MDLHELLEKMKGRPNADQLAVSALIAAIEKLVDGAATKSVRLSVAGGEVRVRWAVPKASPAETKRWAERCCSTPRLQRHSGGETCTSCGTDFPTKE